MAEHPTVNRVVPGSSPGRAADTILLWLKKKLLHLQLAVAKGLVLDFLSTSAQQALTFYVFGLRWNFEQDARKTRTT